MAEEQYVNTPFDAMRDTGILVCKCGRMLAPSNLVAGQTGEKACPNCGTEQSKMSRLLVREGE